MSGSFVGDSAVDILIGAGTGPTLPKFLLGRVSGIANLVKFLERCSHSFSPHVYVQLQLIHVGHQPCKPRDLSTIASLQGSEDANQILIQCWLLRIIWERVAFSLLSHCILDTPLSFALHLLATVCSRTPRMLWVARSCLGGQNHPHLWKK